MNLYDIMPWLDRHSAEVTRGVLSFVLLVVAALAIPAVRSLLLRSTSSFHRRLHLSERAFPAIARVVSAVLWGAVLLFLLNLWGISVDGLWTFLVSLATLIGVGFLATWAMVSNVTAQFLLRAARPFHIGDEVSLLPEGLKGRINEQGLMFTELHEEDGTKLYIPNNLFFQKIFRVQRPSPIRLAPPPSRLTASNRSASPSGAAAGGSAQPLPATPDRSAGARRNIVG